MILINDFEQVLTQLEKERGIDRAVLIEAIESSRSELADRISSKMQQSDVLREQLRLQSEKLREPGEQVRPAKVVYVAGAQNISMDAVRPIADDRNALIILFRDFEIGASFIGKRPSQVFLVLEFLESESVTTAGVDSKSGWFTNRPLQFVCKNDFILSTYFSKSAIPVQMCRARQDRITEIGKSELNLTPLVTDGITAFSSSINIWNTAGKIVARINFELALLKPLVA
jgi:hypothetical protein